MSGVRRRAGVASLDCFTEAIVGDGSAEPAIADAEELAVPHRLGKPDLDVDVRVA